MSSTENFSYNEEYDHTLHQGSSDPHEYYVISSDSENDGKKNFSYFDLSSSSYESDSGEEEDYFHKFTQPEFLECNRNDDEDDNIIPLETDDCDFENVKLDAYGQMTCRICSIAFKSKIRFIIHRRRHVALDHFACPVCQKGFTKLEQCQAHEFKEHKEAQDAENADATKTNVRYFFRTRNARKSLNVDEFHVDEDDLVQIFPSTCLYPYDGPDIEDVYQSYQIEVKYGRTERKSHSRIQSKFALECQKRKKLELEDRLAKLHAREERRKKRERERRVLQNQQNQQGKYENDIEEIIVKTAKAHIAAAPPRQIFKTGNEGKGPKCYFCTLCGFTSVHEGDIEDHQQEHHPEVPLASLIKFLHVDRTRNKNRATDGDESRRKGKMRLREKQTPAQIARAKRLEKKEKLKEAKLFRKRRHIPRVWEKEAGSPTFDEYLFAIGLSRKEDVLIRPRVTRQVLITSKLLRDQTKEIQVDPGENKTIRIPLKRMTTIFNGTKRFLVCDKCDFFAPSKMDVRRHRRAVHLPVLRQSVNSEAETEETPQPKVPSTDVSVMDLLADKRRKGVQPSINPVAAEVIVQRFDDAGPLGAGVKSKRVTNRTDPIAHPSKKFKVS